MKYYLIGMPGCGKSTVGKELAHLAHIGFVDLDKYIEKKENKTIPQIFDEYGEAYFRDLESKALEEVAQMDNVVISCGGGIVVRQSNKVLMKGIIVYLNVPLDTLELRLHKDTNNKRPLMRTLNVADIYNSRKDKYIEFMDFQVFNQIVSTSAKQILKEAKKHAKAKNFGN